MRSLPAWRVDLIALAIVWGLTALGQPQLFARDTLVSLDSATQFLPWYAFLGEALRAGQVPGWNPSSFSGTPFAAAPLSGWMYLPAMALFTALPFVPAARAYLLFSPLLAGSAAYVFARSLGMRPIGAVLAATAYACMPFLQVQNLCCFAFAAVYVWLPVVLLGAERGLRATGPGQRWGWWGVAGLGLSQIFAGWLGQGSIYALLVLGVWVAMRTLLPEAAEPHLPQQRLVRMATHLAVIGSIGFALGAAGLFPRIAYNAASNLAGGYVGAEAAVGGLSQRDWLLLGTPGFWYVGLSVLALAVAAPFVARGRLKRPMWLFGGVSLGILLLTGLEETPLHWLLYHVVPGFARLHPHLPERILTVWYLGLSLLAGATVASLERWRRLPRRLAALLAAGVVLMVFVDVRAGAEMARSQYALADPLHGADRLAAVDLAAYVQPTEAARFLQRQVGGEPWRYLGYAPEVQGRTLPYTTRFFDPGTAALLVNNRAIGLGLQDVQGYDAQHLARYDAYLVALNGRTQNYHDAQVFADGLRSPLLNLLNVRYVLVPAREDPPQAGVAWARRAFPVVYEDAQVQVLENRWAYPRAWIVHRAAQVAPGDALALIAEGRVDARLTALIEQAPPPLGVPADASQDAATVTHATADRLTVQVNTAAPGLLVLSEIYDPAWKATIDGKAVPVLVANGALRAVPIPAGQHVVEMRYASEALFTGIAVSGATSLAFVCLGGWLVRRRVRLSLARRALG